VSSLHDAFQSDSTSGFTVCSVCESPFNTTLRAAAALAGLAQCPVVSRRGSAVSPVQLGSSMSSSCMSIFSLKIKKQKLGSSHQEKTADFFVPKK
jgi:hypothetical protein